MHKQVLINTILQTRTMLFAAHIGSSEKNEINNVK